MKKLTMIIGLLILVSLVSFATDIRLIVNDNDITSYSNPVVINDRLMVPIKFVTDEIGGQTVWNGDDRTVTITKGASSINLWIDSPVFLLNGDYLISDVAPKIINDRTYVPVKLISNVFGIDVAWQEDTRQVIVDSNKSADYQDAFKMKVDLDEASKITGKTSISIRNLDLKMGQSIKLLLLDEKTMTGFIVASDIVTSEITYLPRIEDKGEKILVAAVYDEDRRFLAGDAVKINIDVQPNVDVTGVDDASYKDKVIIGQELNFLAEYVSYKITQVSNGEEEWISKRDPEDTYSFKPTFENNGAYKITVYAYDGQGNAYASPEETVVFDVDRYLNMGGIKNDQTIRGQVSLIASRNFDVNETIFYIKDVNSGSVNTLATIPWGAYKWTPTAADTGLKDIWVSVIDPKGIVYNSSPIRVNVDTSPIITLKGVGPNQVLTSDVDLSATSNVKLDQVSYYLSDGTLIGQSSFEDSVTFKPTSNGPITLYASAEYQGKTIKSDTVTLKVYLDPLYGSRPVVGQSEFKAFITPYALKSFEDTGMVASLQVAQAILETGWGQKLPVDKYTGQFSYNLFGIKGSATNGSVTSNTWEVYNGVSFRVDANFRAYYSIDESWQDHKRILLDLSRYEPYRQVMYDSTLAAYAIRRCGYATDPNYPMKLIDIINRYGLKELDRVGVYLK